MTPPLLSDRTSRHRILVLGLVLSSGLGCARPGDEALSSAAASAGVAEIEVSDPVTAVGEGFLVWESNRTGRWRLWIRDLDGSDPRQLSADEGRRLHCCPHISPDGEWIAYLSLPPDQEGYPKGGAVGSMYLIRPDGSDQRMLLPEARTYYENRAAVWRSPKELIYIEADGHSALFDLESGSSRRLTRATDEEHPWLINSSLTWAASGLGGISPYDPERLAVAERTPLPGCQPYFSHDGRWGYWVVAPGGPIRALHLESGSSRTLLHKSDRRLPDGLGYLYFPMLSCDGRLLAFAASADEHHHFEADYEIFVAETDPETLELLGKPVRFTRHPATDRFPDVFPQPLPLGRHSGESPFRWAHRPPGPEVLWRWSYGDGATSTGTVGEHTFQQPGRFEVVAASADRLLRGQVVVSETRPPQVLSLSLMGDGQEIAVVFDESIRLDRLDAHLDSGISITDSSVDRDDRRLRLRLSEPITGNDRLHLAGISDQAQQPNRLPATALAVEPPAWPSDRSGLAFLWETGDSANLVYDPELDAETSGTLTASGTAVLDHHFALKPSGGRFLAPDAAGLRITADCQATYELSIEAVVQPDPAPKADSGLILTTATKSRRNFSLEQRGSQLVFGIRMASRGEGAYPMIPLFDLPTGKQSHVVVTFIPGLVQAYRDGELMVTDRSILGGFFHWRWAPLLVGSDWNGGRKWRGTLEGLAIYNRALEAEEVSENYLRYRAKLEARPAIDRWVALAMRTDCSAVPSLEEISPYREALSVCEYTVDKTLEGQPLGAKVRVAQWSILDGSRVPPEATAGDRSSRLELTRYQDNPQLESVFLSDTLKPVDGGPLLYLQNH